MKAIYLIMPFLLAGCATSPAHDPLDYSHVRIVASTETRENPEYRKDFNDCDWYATSDHVNPARNAAGGALLGAGLASAFGAIMGLDSGYARLAGVGALSGGLGGLAGTKVNNDMRYKEIMLQCLRKRGHEVY